MARVAAVAMAALRLSAFCPPLNDGMVIFLVTSVSISGDMPLASLPMTITEDCFTEAV